MIDLLAHAHDAFVLLFKVSMAASVLLALGLIIHYAFWPEWTQDPDPMLARLLARYPRSEYVTRYVEDHTVAEWERNQIHADMVKESCAQLRDGSYTARFTAPKGENYSSIYDVSEAEYSRLLEQDPESYE